MKTPGPGGTIRIDDGTDARAQVARGLKDDLAPLLVVIEGPDVGVRVRLTHSITIGRGAGADLVLADDRVSTQHARIEDRGDTWAVVDLGSTNGTRLDGATVTDAILHHQGKLELGVTTLRFEFQDAKDQAYGELVERLISTDDLTGLYVRRRFDRELAALFAAGEMPIALLVMDLDGIKHLNDTHGHLYGAHVISEAGHRIGEVLAGVPDAFGARFGGDEYTVAAPRLSRDRARALAERIRAAVADRPYSKDGLELRVGVSVGLAVAPDDAADAEALFRVADAAMYAAKRAGKNRVAG
jgi:diguanylate cyclase (GGDEF)-like protein